MTEVKQKKKYTLFTNKALFFLILPIVIEAALSMSLGLVDSLMVKDIGDYGNAMSAVSNVDQVSNLIIHLFAAFGVGGAVITSQLIGAGKADEANKSAKQLVVLMLIASLIVASLCLVLNHQIVNLFFGGDNDNAQYLNFAYTYFYFTAASFPFIAIFNSCAALLRAQRKSMNTMLSGAISFALNVGLNAVFIYALKLEILGAALATFLARIFPAAFTLILMTGKHNLVRLHIFARKTFTTKKGKTFGIIVFDKFRFDWNMLKRIFRLAIPSGIENCLFQLGKVLVISFITIPAYWVVGSDGIAYNVNNTANSIAYQINTISSIVGNGINTATLTVIGQAVGTGDIGQVKYYIKKMLLINYLGNAACVGITWACATPLINFFGTSITPETADIVHKCITVALSVQFVTYPLSFGLPAVLKANSDMKYVMFTAILSMVLMRVGLCYILTCDWAGLHMGAMGLWVGMVSDWGLRSLFFGGRLMSGRWKRSSGLLNADKKESQDEASDV